MRQGSLGTFAQIRFDAEETLCECYISKETGKPPLILEILTSHGSRVPISLPVLTLRCVPLLAVTLSIDRRQLEQMLNARPFYQMTPNP